MTRDELNGVIKDLPEEQRVKVLEGWQNMEKGFTEATQARSKFEGELADERRKREAYENMFEALGTAPAAGTEPAPTSRGDGLESRAERTRQARLPEVYDPEALLDGLTGLIRTEFQNFGQVLAKEYETDQKRRFETFGQEVQRSLTWTREIDQIRAGRPDVDIDRVMKRAQQDGLRSLHSAYRLEYGDVLMKEAAEKAAADATAAARKKAEDEFRGRTTEGAAGGLAEIRRAPSLATAKIPGSLAEAEAMAVKMLQEKGYPRA